MAEVRKVISRLAEELVQALADQRLEAFDVTWHGVGGPFSGTGVKKWEQIAEERPDDLTVTHSLAVLYLCKALDEEFANEPRAARQLWRRMWKNWGRLLRQQEFWDRLQERFSGNSFYAEVQWAEVRQLLQQELLQVHVELAIHYYLQRDLESARWHRKFISNAPCGKSHKDTALKAISDELAAGIPRAVEAGEYDTAVAKALDYLTVMGSNDKLGIEMLVTAAVELGHQLWIEANNPLSNMAAAQRELVQLVLDCRPALREIVRQKDPSPITAEAAARLCLWAGTILLQDVAGIVGLPQPTNPEQKADASIRTHARAWLDWARQLDQAGALEEAISKWEDVCLQEELRTQVAGLQKPGAVLLVNAAQMAEEAEEKAKRLTLAPRSFLMVAELWKAAGNTDKEVQALQRAAKDALTCNEPELADQAKSRLNEIGSL